MSNVNALALQLFNCVLKKEKSQELFLEDYGVFVTSEAAYAISTIKSFLKEKKLSGEELNKTFHKSWKKVKNTDRYELALHQVLHYLSTYGTNFEGEVYIPNEVLEIPETKLQVSIIDAVSKEELVKKCLDILESGMALKETTLNDLFKVLELVNYTFTGNENIRNKEAMILLANKFNILPKKAEDLLRYIVYLYTGETSMVKNNVLLDSIKSNRKVSLNKLLDNNALRTLAEIFNRNKKVFLSIKLSNKNNKSVVNKISKLSKTLHKPLPQNALNLVTRNKLTKNEVHWLDNATLYALFKAISACHSRLEGQESFVYRIRNGKSWAKEENNVLVDVCKHNYEFLVTYLKNRFNGQNKTVLIPKEVEYALPTSEKLFVGNIPTGTKFTAKRLAVGMYWEDNWGAYDLDLSAINIGGKIGWNSKYYDEKQELVYSGDMTNAHDGAVEYLHASAKGDIPPTLVCSNVFGGQSNAGYKIVVGKGDKVSRNYMMNPNNLMAEARTEGVQRKNILGMLQKSDEGKVSFVLLNFGAGHARVEGTGSVNTLFTNALYQQWKNPVILNKLLKDLNFNVVSKVKESEKVDFDLNINKLTKTTFVDLFK